MHILGACLHKCVRYEVSVIKPVDRRTVHRRLQWWQRWCQWRRCQRRHTTDNSWLHGSSAISKSANNKDGMNPRKELAWFNYLYNIYKPVPRKSWSVARSMWYSTGERVFTRWRSVSGKWVLSWSCTTSTRRWWMIQHLPCVSAIEFGEVMCKYLCAQWRKKFKWRLILFSYHMIISLKWAKLSFKMSGIYQQFFLLTFCTMPVHLSNSSIVPLDFFHLP